MKTARIYILVLILPFVLLLNCKKEESNFSPLYPENLKLFQDPEVKLVLEAVPGDGVVLLRYIDNFDQYQFKLIDNSGKELWTKNFGYQYEILVYPNTAFIKLGTAVDVLYDVDKTFAIIRGNRLEKINHQGEVVFNDTSFFSGLETVDISKIMLGRNDRYLFLGGSNISGNRAVAIEFDRQGKRNFIVPSSNIGSVNKFSDALILENGDYLVAGVNLGGIHSMNLALIKANGSLEVLKTHDIKNFEGEGRTLLPTDNGDNIFLVSASNPNLEDRRSRIYRFNELGEIMEINYLDLADFNYCRSHSLLKKADGSFFGLAKTADEVPEILDFKPNSTLLVAKPGTYTPPNFSYHFSLNKEGQIQNQTYFQSNYSNFFNSAMQLSNGNLLIYGAIQSLGEEVKLSILINKP